MWSFEPVKERIGHVCITKTMRHFAFEDVWGSVEKGSMDGRLHSNNRRNESAPLLVVAVVTVLVGRRRRPKADADFAKHDNSMTHKRRAAQRPVNGHLFMDKVVVVTNMITNKSNVESQHHQHAR